MSGLAPRDAATFVFLAHPGPRTVNTLRRLDGLCLMLQAVVTSFVTPISGDFLVQQRQVTINHLWLDGPWVQITRATTAPGVLWFLATLKLLHSHPAGRSPLLAQDLFYFPPNITFILFYFS